MSTYLDKEPLPLLDAAGGANPLYDTDDSGAPTSDGVEDFRMGLSWEEKGAGQKKTLADRAKRAVRKQKGEITTTESDLDAGALFFVGAKPTKYLGFDNFQPFKDETEPGAAQSANHSGDNQTGAGDGDDETISLRLRQIPKRFTRILIVVGAFKKGSSVAATTDMKATIYDASGGSVQPMAVIEPSLLEDKQILPVARLDRVPGTGRWTLTPAPDESSFNITQGDMRSLLLQSMSALGV